MINSGPHLGRVASLVLCIFAVLGAPASAADPAARSVLIISSYHPGYKWTADINAGLHEVWRQSPYDVSTWVEFLDARRNPNWRPHFETRFQQDLAGRKFDAVVLIDDEAVELWCADPARFAGAPIFFGGVATIPPCHNQNSAGDLESFNFAGLIRFGSVVRPIPARVIAITDESPLSQFFLGKVRESLSGRQSVPLEEWKSRDYLLDELRAKLAALDSRAIVFICGFHHDRLGAYLPQESTFRSLGLASAAPVIALSGEATPGILAGSKNSGYDYGKRIGVRVTRLLGGVKPSVLGTDQERPDGPQIEASELKRWRIPDDLIPADAEVIHRNENFFERYRYWIVALAVFLITQSVVLVSLGFNVLARRRAQEELRESNAKLAIQNEDYRRALDAADAALAIRTRFVANMSHELRTPLNGILGMSELLLASSLSDTDRESIATIHSSTNHLLVILNDILDVSQLESGQLRIVNRPFQPRILFETAVQLFQPATRGSVQLLADIEALPAWLDGDAARIRQILFNLIGNALKFTSSGSITVAAAYQFKELKFLVRDTGIGIPQDQLEAIFGRFAQVDDSSTRQQGGLGLGLYIARELATAMGGRIAVTSEVGCGSCFTVYIPAPTLTDYVEPEAECQAPRLADRKVLVVEDNPVNLKLVTRLLERYGCIVSTAPDGALGVEAALSQSIDLILMDLQMPNMDGYAAARAIRRLDHPNARVPIIALTAGAMDGDRERCLDAGMNDHLAKPISRRELGSVLDRWLNPS